MPNADQQAKATARILEGFGGEPFSVRAAGEYLRKEFMLDLAQAPFDVTIPFKIAGPCGGCSKRSGASPDLFDDVKSGDLCQDSACFHSKARESHEAKLKAAEAAGHILLRGPAAAKLMPGSAQALPSGYAWFDETCPLLTADKRPLSALFGAKQRGVVTLEHSSGAIVRLVKEDDARKLLKAKGLLRPPAPKPKVTSEAAATPAAVPVKAGATEPDKPKTPVATPSSVLLRMKSERADELQAERTLTLILQRMEEDGLPLAVLRMAVMQVADSLSHEALKLVFKTRGWELAEGASWYETEKVTMTALLGHVEADHDGASLGQLLAVVLMAEELTDPSDLEDLEDSEAFGQPTWLLSSALGVEGQLEAIRDQAEIEGAEQVQAEEDERLGKNAAGDAFAAAHAPAAKAMPTKKAPASYRNKATGETWSGRGLQPKWLKVAIAAGARLEDFVVTPA